MAKFQFYLDLAKNQQGNLAGVDTSKVHDAVEQAADYLMDTTKNIGKAMGVYDTGATLDHMVVKGPFDSGLDTYAYVTWDGSRRKNGRTDRYGAIAFYNEYGVRGRPARPFVDSAAREAEEHVIALLKLGVDSIFDL